MVRNDSRFNHPKEFTPEVETALARLADARILLGCQSMLLAGINDCPNIMKDLVHKLVRNRVRPYYMYQCDMVHGAGYFRTPVAVGIQIIEALRGGGKILLMPNYLLSQSVDRVVLRNYEGFISSYTQPGIYEHHDPHTCPSCQRQQREAREEGQEGLAALLTGETLAIVPEGFEATHQRLTRIRWAPIKAALAAEASTGEKEIWQARCT
jgi:lysine 2,3-aminomutase